MFYIYIGSTAEVDGSEDRKMSFHNEGESQYVNLSLAQTYLWIIPGMDETNFMA